MEKDKKEKLKLAVTLAFIVIAFGIAITIMLKYSQEGETNMPFKLPSIKPKKLFVEFGNIFLILLTTKFMKIDNTIIYNINSTIFVIRSGSSGILTLFSIFCKTIDLVIAVR